MRSFIELRDIELRVDLGTYGPNDVVPSAHLIDLKLSIDPQLVMIEADGMESIFDYDPIVSEISRLADACHYETQEWLMTRIARACVAQREILSVEVFLRKTPVISEVGEAGVRLILDDKDMRELRKR